MITNSKNISGRLSGPALDAFTELKQQEGLTEGATMMLIVNEWMSFKGKGARVYRYATVDETKFNLALGVVVQLSRSLNNAQAALKSPRPILPEDQATWIDMIEASKKAVTSSASAIDDLFETAKIYRIPTPSKAHLIAAARISYYWKKPDAPETRKHLFAAIRPWIGEPPPPPAVPPSPLPTPTPAPISQTPTSPKPNSP